VIIMRKESGLTLIELLITVALISMVLGSIYQLFNWGIESWHRSYETLLAREEAARVLNIMKKNIREAVPLTSEPAISLGEQNHLILYANVDSDDPPEKIEYSFSGNELLRKVAEPNTVEPPYTYDDFHETITLTTYCQNNENYPLFSYHASTTETLSDLPLSLKDRQKVKIVGLNLRIDADTQRSPETKGWTAEVTLRNVE